MSACMCIIVCVCVCRDPLPSYTHYRPFSLSHFRLMALYSRAGLAAGGDLAFDCLDAEHMWERTCSCPAESTSLSQSYKHTLPSSLTLSSCSFTFTAPPSHSLTYFNTYCFSLSVRLLDCMSFCMFSYLFFFLALITWESVGIPCFWDIPLWVNSGRMGWDWSLSSLWYQWLHEHISSPTMWWLGVNPTSCQVPGWSEIQKCQFLT